MKTHQKFDKDNMTGKNHSGRRPNTPARHLTSSTIIGDKICNQKGEDMGRIKEIMLDIVDGRISYVVIEFGGFLGFNEKYFAVPFKALVIDTDHHTFILNQHREVLENAPGFDKAHWPETNSHDLKNSAVYWCGFMGPNTGAEY